MRAGIIKMRRGGARLTSLPATWLSDLLFLVLALVLVLPSPTVLLLLAPVLVRRAVLGPTPQ